ncbi:4-hydroxythreonine-4-phosphate dehydrogenase PdxA [Roseiconus nitratireducens]|nr:4-hydroxythreonine-4-phosphate dehydrogenase PdxA [Roseiconus nitratireducens]
MNTSPLIAVTAGDPGGIGPEVCLKAAQNGLRGNARLILFGDAGIFERVARQLDLPMPPVAVSLEQAIGHVSRRPETAVVYDLQAVSPELVSPGKVSALTGKASHSYITASIDAALDGKVDAVATGPIHKEALRLAGVDFPGHTEIFAARTKSDRACMMLTSGELTCSFVTTHVGYRDVPSLLSVDRIVDVIELSHEAMLRVRGQQPRLAICGLNPHAGENGLFGGGEEEEFILPAIETAQRRGIEITGPLPPDTAFLPARRRETDCVVCMYHDQGHIPLKTLAFDVAVNTTLGLPIIRTSVDHGTALDIAWQGVADSQSMVEAIRLATKLASGRIQQVQEVSG